VNPFYSPPHCDIGLTIKLFTAQLIMLWGL